MKTKIISTLFLIALVGILVKSAGAQSRRVKNHRVQIHVKKSSHRHSPNYRYAKLPKWGKTYVSIHKKAHRIVHRGLNYYYYSGIYYKKAGSKYIIARAPIGVRVSTLPRKHIKVVVKGRKYFYYYGTYYIKVEGSNEYETVNPPIGARVDALPEGYKEIQNNGVVYYEFEGTLYKEVIVDNEIWYEVVEILNE